MDADAKLALAGDVNESHPEMGSRAAAMQFESSRLAMLEQMIKCRNNSPVPHDELAGGILKVQEARCFQVSVMRLASIPWDTRASMHSSTEHSRTHRPQRLAQPRRHVHPHRARPSAPAILPRRRRPPLVRIIGGEAWALAPEAGCEQHPDDGKSGFIIIINYIVEIETL